MNGDGLMIVQLAALALLATALLVVWGDLGGFALVRRLPGGVRFLAGLLAMGGMVGVLVGPNYLQSRGVVGKGPPMDLDWRLVALADGREVNLQALKGKVLFINVWATWCGPCVAELPSIERLYSRFAGRDDVAFLLVSQDQSPEVAQQFAAAQGLKAPVYFPKSATPRSFQTEGIPATFIVRKDGTLYLGDVGYKDWGGGTWATQLEELARQPVADQPGSAEAKR